MAPKPYHHGSLEQALADAALDVVRTDGIGALSLRDLARAVGVSPSATYRHFPSRDHLVARVSQRAREALAQQMIDARDALPGHGDDNDNVKGKGKSKSKSKRRSVERFEAIGRAYVTFAVEQPALFEAAFVRCPVLPEREEQPNAWAVLADAIDQMAESGAIPTSRRTDAPIIAWSGVHGLATILTAAIWPAGYTAENEIDAVVKAIYRSIT